MPYNSGIILTIWYYLYMELSNTLDTAETIETTIQNSANSENINKEGAENLLPDMTELPPDTREVITEAYESKVELRTTIEGYIRGTEEYIVQIPKARNIIQENLSDAEEINVEITPEKESYINDTVNLLNISKEVRELYNHDSFTEKDLGKVYEIVKIYADKYDRETLKNSLESLDSIKNITEYYAKTSKATFNRIKDIIKRKEPPVIEWGDIDKFYQILWDFVTDYTQGEGYERTGEYYTSLKALKESFSQNSITDEDFLNVTITRAKELDKEYREILVNKECCKEISKKSGKEYGYGSSVDREPKRYIHDYFDSEISTRMNTITSTLENEIDKKEREDREKQLFNERELNGINERLNELVQRYNENIGKIEESLPGRLRRANRHFNLENDRSGDENYKSIVESQKMLYHGTTNIESMKAIATEGLRSRKKQQEKQGWSYYQTGLDLEADKKKLSGMDNEHESLGVFFAKNFSGSYAYKGDGIFAVGIPQGVAGRKYSIPQNLSSTSDLEMQLFDRKNPSDGCEVSKEDAYLFIGELRLRGLKAQYGQDIEEQMKKNWGSHLIILPSGETPPENLQDFQSENTHDLSPINHARKVPTKHFWTDKFNSRYRAYKIIYS